MKKFSQFLVFSLLVFYASVFTFSDETRIQLYGVHLVDQSDDGTNNNLYSLFNDYLQLEGSEAYTSSIDLFNERGVDPTTQWITSGSSLLQAFNMSAYNHQLNILTSTGEEIYRMYDGGPDYNPDKIYSLSDGLSLDFQLLPFRDNYDYLWSWYSDANKNASGSGPLYYENDPIDWGDDNIHMLAFDITDIYNAKKGTSFSSVFMFGWEDLPEDQWGISEKADFDYNDSVFILTNLTPTVSTTPEPATFLIILIGGGLVSARYLRRKKR
ncbi:MAG: hypothetical protein LBC74_11185 [Planctomycetaceae bacterium]|jgi:hypothetical protein|nr:hypothetical protein [Planctomycetaceae bacterium]